MIGNLNDAAAALADTLPVLSDNGCARMTYLVGNTVYKVNRMNGANEAEWDNYRILSDRLVPGVSFPKMSAYSFPGEIVIAAEYVSGIETGECIDRIIGITCTCDGVCLSAEEEDIVKNFIEDTAWGNIIRTDEGLCIIDLEC